MIGLREGSSAKGSGTPRGGLGVYTYPSAEPTFFPT